VTGSVVVNTGGRMGDVLVTFVADTLPHERVVGATRPAAVPADAEVLVTMLDAPDSVEALLVAPVPWVHTLSAGVDGFPMAAARGKVVTCSRGASSVAMSEWVLAMMLAFEKRLPASWVTEPPVQWNTASLGVLAGRTVGIVGLGSIGTEVARRALAFDMEVLGLRRSHSPAPLPGIRLASSLASLLAASDHVVVCAPATADTAHLIDAHALASCRRGVHLVNVARGTLVDQRALLHALDDGTVAMASLDVVDPEPLPADHPFYAHPRVRVSPHISWSGPTSLTRTMDLFVDNLRRHRAGEALHGVVDLDAGY
jgi:phosphoglycerate dehydrogenase-like enzyme